MAGPDVHIGLDLDNTLIDYDAVFGEIGATLGMLPADRRGLNKAEVRAYLRGQPDGETQWMRLQGQVYGRYLDAARLYPGVVEFLTRLKALGVTVSIVSHKTRYGHYDPARVSLWDAAVAFLDTRGFFAADGFGLRREQVFFEETRAGKLARIDAIQCDIFIDDLPEVLLDPAFPKRTERLWFANGQPASECPGLQGHDTWEALARACETRLGKPAKDA
jgi:hypothetical protein